MYFLFYFILQLLQGVNETRQRQKTQGQVSARKERKKQKEEPRHNEQKLNKRNPLSLFKMHKSISVISKRFKTRKIINYYMLPNTDIQFPR